MSVEDDNPFPGDWVECWQCNGEGEVVGTCWDGCCVDAEEGCEICNHTCDVCRGKGGWEYQPPTAMG